MSLTLAGWLLGIASIALAALLMLRSSRWRLELGSNASKWRLPAVVFLSVVGIGGAAPYLRELPWATGLRGMMSSSPLHPSGDGGALAELKDYARSKGTEEPAVQAAAERLLPDVNTMIERLGARLKAKPDDIQGWRMLGWSYYHTGRFGEAATAYAKAVEIDPNSTELKLAYDEAKAKAAESASLDASSSFDKEAGSKAGYGASAEQVAKSKAMPPHERDAAIRSMVDGLAARLETSPRDVEGWTRLMRARVVLVDKEVAETAFRKALDIFKDDSTASGKIATAAKELGLEAQ